MPELKSVDTSTFEPYPVDPSTIPYHSKAKEKQNMRRGAREKGEGRRERGRGKGRKRGEMTLPWRAGPVMKRSKASPHVKVRVINNTEVQKIIVITVTVALEKWQKRKRQESRGRKRQQKQVNKTSA